MKTLLKKILKKVKTIKTRNKEEYKNKACYNLETDYNFEDELELYRHQKNIYNQMLRIIKTLEKYKEISFFIGASTKKSNSIVVYSKNGKKGRPRKEVLGEDKKPHLHIYVYSESGAMMSSFCNIMKEKLKKKNYNVRISTNDNLYNAINYTENQCERPILGCGIFSVQKK